MNRYKLRTTRTPLLSSLGITASLMLLAPACDPQAGPSSGDSQDAMEPRSTPAELAERYIFDEVSHEESRAMLSEIRALSPDDLREFTRWVVEYQQVTFADEIDPLTSEFVTMLADYAAESGRAPFDLDESEVAEVKARMTGNPAGLRCFPGKVDCAYTTKWEKDPVVGLNFTPASGWLRGYGSDRVSNESCEWFDCDYRLMFNVGATKRKNFVALTTMAYCVQEGFDDKLITYKSGNTQYTLVGYNTASNCEVMSGKYLRENLPLY